MLGASAGFLTLLYWMTILLTLVDKMLNSDCGLRCGFLATVSSVINPFDSFLVFISSYFPADYLVFGVLALYLFLCSLYGLVVNGVKIGCFLVNHIQSMPIKKKKSLPQALLVCSVYMVLIFLGLTQEFLTVVPRYMIFGSQHFEVKGVVEHCSLENFSADRCTMSVSSSFFNK